MAKLTAKARAALPLKKFAGPDRSFPINNPSHARAAISGATRSARAGNITASTEARVKAVAETALKRGHF